MSSLDEGKIGGGARHRAEAVDIAALVLASLLAEVSYVGVILIATWSPKKILI